jgi:hypothetical protein
MQDGIQRDRQRYGWLAAWVKVTITWLSKSLTGVFGAYLVLSFSSIIFIMIFT